MAKRISKYPEAIVEFTYLFYTIRVWTYIEKLEEWDSKKELDDLRNAYLPILETSAPLTLKGVAEVLFEVENVNAVEVKYTSRKDGLVLYKNWP